MMARKPTAAQRAGSKGASRTWVSSQLAMKVAEAQRAVAEELTPKGGTHDIYRRENLRLWRLALRAVRWVRP